VLSKKDFYMRIKICKKEVKESRLWFRLSEPKAEQEEEKEKLIKEPTELLFIFSKIVKSSS
jgi:four helix bundle protein